MNTTERCPKCGEWKYTEKPCWVCTNNLVLEPALSAESSSSPTHGSGALNRLPQTHALKTWPAFYEAVAGGRKPFEARKADRDFEVGDTLRLEEWSPTTREYTGRSSERLVTYIMRGPVFGVEAGWVVLGLALPMPVSDSAEETL